MIKLKNITLSFMIHMYVSVANIKIKYNIKIIKFSFLSTIKIKN